MTFSSKHITNVENIEHITLVINPFTHHNYSVAAHAMNYLQLHMQWSHREHKHKQHKTYHIIINVSGRTTSYTKMTTPSHKRRKSQKRGERKQPDDSLK